MSLRRPGLHGLLVLLPSCASEAPRLLRTAALHLHCLHDRPARPDVDQRCRRTREESAGNAQQKRHINDGLHSRISLNFLFDRRHPNQASEGCRGARFRRYRRSSGLAMSNRSGKRGPTAMSSWSMSFCLANGRASIMACASATSAASSKKTAPRPSARSSHRQCGVACPYLDPRLPGAGDFCKRPSAAENEAARSRRRPLGGPPRCLVCSCR